MPERRFGVRIAAADVEFLFFIGVCVAVSVSPGPAVIYIVTRTLDQGTAAGIASMAGITAGGVVHVCLAAFGVAAVAAAWPVSLLLVQAAGAAYLVWIGWQRMRTAGRTTDIEKPENARLDAVFREGVVVNLTNPKTVLFLVAFLPQFVDDSATSLTAELLILGFTFVAVAALTDLFYVLAAGSLRRRLAGGRIPAWSGYLAGTVYILLGALGFTDAALSWSRLPDAP